MLFTAIPKSVPPDTKLIHHSLLITLFLIFIISLPACFGSLLSPSQLCFYILVAVFYSPVKPRKLLQKAHSQRFDVGVCAAACWSSALRDKAPNPPAAGAQGEER